MKLHEAEILKLLPAWMREDAGNRGLAAGTDEVTRAITARAKLLSRWDKIDQLDETELDELAWELSIKWYDSTAQIEAKRAIIRSSDLVYAKMGTKFAVNQVITDYYGFGGIDECFEYGGKHDHFRVHLENCHIGLDEFLRFKKILNIVKRRSSWLDEIIITSPAVRGKISITQHLAPRIGRAAAPPYHPRLPAGNFPATPLLGVRYSTVTLPMAEEHKGGQQNGL